MVFLFSNFEVVEHRRAEGVHRRRFIVKTRAGTHAYQVFNDSIK